MVDCHQPITDSQWQVIAPLLPIQRKRRHCLRVIVDALGYIYPVALTASGAACLAFFRRGQRCITTSVAGN